MNFEAEFLPGRQSLSFWPTAEFLAKEKMEPVGVPFFAFGRCRKWLEVATRAPGPWRS